MGRTWIIINLTRGKQAEFPKFDRDCWSEVASENGWDSGDLMKAIPQQSDCPCQVLYSPSFQSRPHAQKIDFSDTKFISFVESNLGVSMKVLWLDYQRS